MNITSDELRRIVGVLDAVTDSFVELVRIAGLRPARDLRGADLRGVNFRADDLSGFDFSGADLTGTDLSMARGLHRAIFLNVKTDRTTRGLYRLVELAAAPPGNHTKPALSSKQSKVLAVEPPRAESPQFGDSYDSKTKRKKRKHHSLPKNPATSVRGSITPEYIICLEDGKHVTNLKKHIHTAHHLSPREYREKWQLPKDYPMFAPNHTPKSKSRVRRRQKTPGYKPA